MAPGDGYPIEEFLESITAQLDRTQDALRLKAVNRPLTFALKDFTVDLQVFVEMDADGKVVFRPARPNETGASTVNLSFTTITRPMIEENTVSLEMTQAPTLSELGFGDRESKELEKLGVRNAAQLRNFERHAGEDTLSRFSGVNLGRIRSALDLSRPRISGIDADDGVDIPPFGPLPSTAEPAAPVSEPEPIDVASEPPVEEPAPEPSPWPGGPGFDRPTLGRPLRPQPVRDPRLIANPVDPGAGTPLTPGGGFLADRIRQAQGGRGGQRLRKPAAPPATGTIKLAPGARRVKIRGENLIDGPRQPRAALAGRPLPVLGATAASVSFGLPEGVEPGLLEIELPDGRRVRYQIDLDGEG